MKGFTRRLCAVALGATTAIIAVAAPGAVAGGVTRPAVSSGCTARSGVTVIVDFTHFGGAVERGCAPGHPADGLIALHEAGFTTAGTAQYGDAFVCRIDSLPSPKQDACAVTPSASAFWAFWNARPTDAAWTFTEVGVLDYQPAAGSIEAFAFGSRVQPSIPPTAALPPTTTTRPTAPTTGGSSSPVTSSPPTTAAPPVSAATVAPHPGPTQVPAITTKPRATIQTTPTSTRRTRPISARVAPTTTATLPHIIDRSASGPLARGSSGSPVPAILTVVVVGSLAIGAFAVARARRRRPA